MKKVKRISTKDLRKIIQEETRKSKAMSNSRRMPSLASLLFEEDLAQMASQADAKPVTLVVLYGPPAAGKGAAKGAVGEFAGVDADTNFEDWLDAMSDEDASAYFQEEDARMVNAMTETLPPLVFAEIAGRINGGEDYDSVIGDYYHVNETGKKQELGDVLDKTSYDKANRTSLKGKRGLGLNKSLPIFDKIRNEIGLPVLTDVHSAEQCSIVSNHVDVLQIPAFLCRQTDLLIAAAKTNKIINVKKGQFLAPWDMVNVTKKISDSGNKNILVTERGASFGYNTLVSDMRSLPIMAKNGYPVIFDATHSVQQPGGQGESSGGQREFVEYLARAAVAVGVAGVFIETHQDPDNAPSDGPNMVPLNKLENLLKQLQDIDNLIKK